MGTHLCRHPFAIAAAESWLELATCPPHALTMKGAWYYKVHQKEWVAKEGVFVWETPGSTHTLYSSDDYEENLICFVVFGALDFLDDDDNTKMLFYWKTAAAMQYQACQDQGITCPDLTRPRPMVTASP